MFDRLGERCNAPHAQRISAAAFACRYLEKATTTPAAWVQVAMRFGFPALLLASRESNPHSPQAFA